VPGVEQQEDVGTQSNLGVGGPAVVVEEFLALCRGEVDTGHGPAHRTSGTNCHPSIIPVGESPTEKAGLS
jgi:hypothetical protein